MTKCNTYPHPCAIAEAQMKLLSTSFCPVPDLLPYENLSLPSKLRNEIKPIISEKSFLWHHHFRTLQSRSKSLQPLAAPQPLENDGKISAASHRHHRVFGG